MAESTSKSKNLEIPDEGLVVHLKSLGNLIVFQKNFKTKNTDTTLCTYLIKMHWLQLPEQNKDPYIHSLGH